MRNGFTNTLVAAGILVLAGCTLAPKYRRPVAPVSGNWPAGLAYGSARADANPANPAPAAEIGWRDFFSDPRLQRIVGLALENNRDLRIATLNVELIQQQYRIQRSELYPSLGASASASRGRTPAGLSPFGVAATRNEYSVGLAVTSFELDLFGRVRSLKAQALERYFSTEEARRSAQLSLVSEVAIQYLNERQLAEQLAVAEQTFQATQSSLNLTQRSFEVGTASELDVRSAEAQVQTARSNVASYTRLRAQAENALVALVGEPLPADLPPPQALESQHVVADVPAGLPADLLERRPDILSAEHDLKAANANIGAARAAFFPSISLTGSVGYASTELSGLFKDNGTTWSFGPQANLPLFTAGRNFASLGVARAAQRIQVASYERAIQNAFREVADGLTARATLDEQIAALEARVRAEQRRFDLANLRYREGVESFLTVLTAQQDLYSAQQILLQSRFTRLANLVSLYKALGGGWTETSAAKPNLRSR